MGPRVHPATKDSAILATDLDGTLLGGSDEDRRRLSEVITNCGDIMVVFVTGRGVESVIPVLNDMLVPRPDYIVADVGATVVDAQTLEPVQPLQAEIDAAWPGAQAIVDHLAHFETLRRQEVPQERRCSFFFTGTDEERAEIERVVVEELGCDALFSAGVYFDVLPRGVSKGVTIRRLQKHLGLDEIPLVVAGDTLNDLSMFQVGAKGICVSNAEAPLIEALEATPSCGALIASAEGAAGILEGLQHYDVVRPEAVEIAPPPKGHAELVMVYHRLPFEEVRRGDKTVRRRPKSPNGIIPSLLGFFANGRAGSWVAWSMQPTREPDDFETTVPVDPERYPKLEASRIALTSDDVNRFYKEFSKEAFWPVIFSFPERAVFRDDQWRHYVEINRLFAERAAKDAAENAVVWIHDYNLWMVPAFLRRLRPDVRIAFFHHTAFPPSDVFNMIPWRREIVGSLAQCDYVGFHIPRYVENFVDVLRSHGQVEIKETEPSAPRFVTFGCALGVDTTTRTVTIDGRTLRMGAHPVGIDVENVRRIVASEPVRDLMSKIEDEIGDRQCVLSVERLDYVKGPIAKLEAFERLLDEHPELHGKVVLLNVVTPAAPGMRIYRSILEKLNQIVGRVNGRFGTIDWTPVRYFLRSLPFEQVIANLAVADIAWITPLRDGLNLVAKEFIAAKDAADRDGVLILSEFAGAAVQMHAALRTNPYHVADMADVLHRALEMAPGERRQRTRRMAAIVRDGDIGWWGRDFLGAVEA